MGIDAQAERMRSLVLLRAACETVLHRLDEDDIDDLALTIQVSELCEALSADFERFAQRNRTPDA